MGLLNDDYICIYHQEVYVSQIRHILQTFMHWLTWIKTTETQWDTNIVFIIIDARINAVLLDIHKMFSKKK